MSRLTYRFQIAMELFALQILFFVLIKQTIAWKKPDCRYCPCYSPKVYCPPPPRCPPLFCPPPKCPPMYCPPPPKCPPRYCPPVICPPLVCPPCFPPYKPYVCILFIEISNIVLKVF
uniref:Uncharacterized protein n=1 Tax=Onchocerca volvulus TaxID=6282 RepID=A0A8R1XVF5_ONCVO